MSGKWVTHIGVIPHVGTSSFSGPIKLEEKDLLDSWTEH